MEVATALATAAIGAAVMWGSVEHDIGWGDSGPAAGYFPFRIGVIMFIASAVTFVINVRASSSASSNFVDRSQVKQVLQVLVPTAVFVATIGVLGIYLAAALFITFFMWWLGKYPVYKILPIAILIPIVLFFMFEIWFLVPLPKGPIEDALGY
jgi:hypothetical protein